MEWLFDQILTLIGLSFLLLIIAAVGAPLESLGWWAGWSGKPPRLDDLDIEAGKEEASVADLPPEKDYYVVYLSGIGVATADGLAADEIDFIDQLTAIMPNAEIITEVFPYSVNNNPLTGHRALSPLWQKIRGIQEKNPESLLAMITINIRNILQVAVSADPRYGPIYSLGVAHEIGRSLAHHGYRLGSHKPVFLIGFSGGGQVSVGTATYLSPLIDAPVYIASIGGVISDDPGIRHVKHLTHFIGTKDPFQKVGEILWPGRWPVMQQSAWNRARAEGKVEIVNLGPMAHNMLGGYYDVRVSLPDGRNFCVATADAVKDAIVAAGA
jgi:hypothetical protein